MKTSVNLKVGFWIILILYIAILVYTLIKDFAINKSTISEKGFKGILSDVTEDVSKELSDNAKLISSDNNEGNSISSMVSSVVTVNCPMCGASVVKGKKFCAKCGGKMQDDDNNVYSFKLPIKVGRENKMITVNEYILSLKNIRCDKCNELIVAGKKFCPDCGNEIIAVELKTNCEKCNAELFYGKKYCVDCGTKVD